MKLVIAIAHERDKHKLGDTLLENGFTFTKLGSTGGFLRQGSVTVMIGVEDQQVEQVMGLLQSSCGVSERFVNVPGDFSALPAAMGGTFPPHPMKIESGGAVAFVLDVVSFQKL